MDLLAFPTDVYTALLSHETNITIVFLMYHTCKYLNQFLGQVMKLNKISKTNLAIQLQRESADRREWNVVKWLLTQFHVQPHETTLQAALNQKKSHILRIPRVVRYLEKFEGAQTYLELLRVAVRLNQIDNLSYLFNRINDMFHHTTKDRCVYDIFDELYIATSRCDNFEIFRWVLKQHAQILPMASTGKRTSRLIPLRSHCQSEDNNIFECVTKGGSLEIFKWITNKMCNQNRTISSGIYYVLILNGHLKILEWIIDNNYYTPGIICATIAAEGNQPHIIEWLISHGCLIDVEQCYCMTMSRGNYETFIKLVEMGLEIPQLIMTYWPFKLSSGHGKIIEWLLTHNHELDHRLCSEIIREGRLDLLMKVSNKSYYRNNIMFILHEIQWTASNPVIFKWFVQEFESHIDFPTIYSYVMWRGCPDIVKWLVDEKKIETSG